MKNKKQQQNKTKKKKKKKKKRKRKKKGMIVKIVKISGPFSGVVGSVGSLPRQFPVFNFFCLLVSSVSDFRPDTGGQWWTLIYLFIFFRLPCSVALWGGRDAANSTVVCTQCFSLAGPVPACGTQTALALRCSAENRLRPALGCVHLPCLSRSGLALR